MLPSTIGAAAMNASSPSKASSKPRISSPLSWALGSLAGMTRMPLYPWPARVVWSVNPLCGDK